MQVDLSLEMKHLNLGHKRRNTRFNHIVNRITSNPCSSIPGALHDWAEVKGAYRFFSNNKIDASAISVSINEATKDRCANQQTVLSIQDTTNVCFSSRAEGLGYLDHGEGNGFMVHNTMAVDTNGCALGLIHQKIWVRDRAEMGKKKTRASRNIEDKESYKWIEGVKKAEDVLINKHIIHIADREADVYELFAAHRTANSDLLIRSTHERKTILGNSMWSEIEAETPIAYFDLEVENIASGTSRTASMVIKTGMVIVAAPVHKAQLPAMLLYGIIVTETDALSGKPLLWRLISSVPVTDHSHALQLVKYYSYRWRIERFHYIMKSGCKLEELQLRDEKALRRATVVYSLCAFKLMQMLYYSRTAPELPCDLFFEEKEWQVMAMVHYKRKVISKKPLSLKLAITILGKLGGFLGRKNDGEPGIKNTWRGLQKLHAMMIPFDIHPLDLSTF